MSDTGIDKDAHYGRYQKDEDWRRKLAKRMSHKALDIPLDDEMNVDNSRRGMGWKELAVVVAGMIGGGYLWSQSQDSPPPAAVAPEAPSAEGKVRIRAFWGDKEIMPGEFEEATITE